MNNENEIFDENGINEILKMLKYSGYCDPNADRCRICLKCKYYFFAEALVNAGIGDKKQAVKEFCARLNDELDNSVVEQSSEFNEGYNDCLFDIGKLIDNLITELYGADE